MSALFYPPVGGQLIIALIDSAKKRGEEGQYVKHEGSVSQMMALAEKGKQDGLEVRIYYQNLIANGGEPVASKIIETWIPPFHVQPFHTHHRVHEMTMMLEGSILAVDSDTLDEDDLKAVVKTSAVLGAGRVVHDHEMVIEGPGTRHTVVNPTSNYSKMLTVQTARMPIEQFDSDWHGDKPLTAAT